MEFLDNDVGAVCLVCGKRDFLPFRCKGCKKMLCLEHRSPALHECAGLNITDATSMDCVICGKSIVHDKNRDVNEVWENHFATECTKVIAQDKKKVVCPVKSCRNILGPSNTFKCHKCSQIVCLSHRNPDYHHCVKDDKGLVDEQIHKALGFQLSAKSLTWSYANILHALHARRRIVELFENTFSTGKQKDYIWVKFLALMSHSAFCLSQ